MFQHQNVLTNRRTGEPRLLRRHSERDLQRAERSKIEIGVAPLQHAHRLEGVTFERLHQLLLKRRATAGGAECPVAGGAAGAAGNLRQFGGVKLAILIPVEFAVGRKGDVIHVEIKPHADGVGGD